MCVCSVSWTDDSGWETLQRDCTSPSQTLCCPLLVLRYWQELQWNWVPGSAKSALSRWRDHRAPNPFCHPLNDRMQYLTMGSRLCSSPLQNVIPAAPLRPFLKSLCSLAEVVAVPHGRGRWHRRKRNQTHGNEGSWWSSVRAPLCCAVDLSANLVKTEQSGTVRA